MSVLFSKELRKDVENSEFIVPLSSKLVRIPIYQWILETISQRLTAIITPATIF